jgi:addiction module HigA family antidote
MKMTRIFNPPHPGEVLRDGVFNGTGITITAFAQRIGVTRVTLSNVLNGKNGISADMAVRLAAALGGSAESWLNLQLQYDLANSEMALKETVAKIQPMAMDFTTSDQIPIR